MLTRHVLETVAVQVRHWNEQGDPVRVSVNVSAADSLAGLAGVIGQGWYFGRPMTVEGLRVWRRRQTPLPAA